MSVLSNPKALWMVRYSSYNLGHLYFTRKTFNCSFAAVQRIYTVLMYCNKSTLWEFLGTFLKILLTYLISLGDFQKTLLFVVK